MHVEIPVHRVVFDPPPVTPHIDAVLQSTPSTLTVSTQSLSPRNSPYLHCKQPTKGPLLDSETTLHAPNQLVCTIKNQTSLCFPTKNQSTTLLARQNQPHVLTTQPLFLYNKNRAITPSHGCREPANLHIALTKPLSSA